MLFRKPSCEERSKLNSVDATNKNLTVHPTNPRYFTDGNGKAIYLTGSHTWNNLQHNEVYPSVDYDKYHGSIADGTESIALIGESDWDVESIEVKIRDAEGEWLALVWRYQDLSNFDSWWLSIAGGALEAWPKVGDYEGAARASGAVPFDPAKEFTFKVVINGNDFDAFFVLVVLNSPSLPPRSLMILMMVMRKQI